jgi:hypothetical protein
VAQHVLSGGLTHYNRLTGAVLLTLGLQLLQLLIYAILRLRKRSHALTYLPSMLMLFDPIIIRSTFGMKNAKRSKKSERGVQMPAIK